MTSVPLAYGVQTDRGWLLIGRLELSRDPLYVMPETRALFVFEDSQKGRISVEEARRGTRIYFYYRNSGRKRRFGEVVDDRIIAFHDIT